MNFHGCKIIILFLGSLCFQLASAQTYHWQIPKAKVIPRGNLEWAPQTFEFSVSPGATVRYIDFQDGNDNNDGKTKNTAWKHHPWDPNAKGNPANAQGTYTYVFKRGVVYRGKLKANQSGEKTNPVTLTSDPSWGEGEASFYGSIKIAEGWQKATSEVAPRFPSSEKLWYIDLKVSEPPRALWETRGKTITRIPIARHPNWTIKSIADIKSDWFTWEHAEAYDETINGKKVSNVLAIDQKNLTFQDKNSLVGATVWTEYVGVMGTPYATAIADYFPESGKMKFERIYGSGGRTPIINCRYYLENAPVFLDSPGEYYFEEKGEFKGRLYIRLPNDRNPNTSTVEVATRLQMIDIQDQNHIKISGLTFRFMNVWNPHDRHFVHRDVTPACIRAFNNVEGIEISNCVFEHVPQAIFMEAEEPLSRISQIMVRDNVIRYTDHSAITIKDGSSWGKKGADIGVLHKVDVLRNKLYEIGPRPIRSESSHAMQITNGELVEIAGNFLENCYGAGIFVFGGKGADVRDKPLIRILIHHNKVKNPLLNTNDWGGIETWQGGPVYTYNNVSVNPGGYWHWKHLQQEDPLKRTHNSARFGFAYYLDGAFKNYLFNNIAIGHSNDLVSRTCNSCGLQEIIGFQNAFFNNTFYRFGAGSRRQAAMAGRNYYLGNIWQDMGEFYFRHAQPRMAEADQNVADAEKAGKLDQPYDYKTLAYKNNIFYGNPRDFGVFEHTGIVYPTIDRFQNALEKRETLTSVTGINDHVATIPNAPEHDFRLAENSRAINNGTRFFVPWSLYAVVGEWNFYTNHTDPLIIHDEHWYMTDEYTNRSMYRFVPRYDLATVNITKDDFHEGSLENWTNGCLSLNGEDQYCMVPDNVMKSDYSFDGGDKQRQLQGSYKGMNRKNMDMAANNFLIETVFKADDIKKMPLINKIGNGNGYELKITKKGSLVFEILSNGKKISVTSNNKLEKDTWHHVIVEADRENGKLRIYLDGLQDNATNISNIKPQQSLENNGDFLIGKSPENSFFKGSIDFVRICRGTLADAKTSIEELYEWQFNGPFLRDFTGNQPADKMRDAGAIEYQ